jgi:hypothetical protein
MLFFSPALTASLCESQGCNSFPPLVLCQAAVATGAATLLLNFTGLFWLECSPEAAHLLFVSWRLILLSIELT